VFRELYVGALPHPSRRQTWTLILAKRTAILRVESETAKEAFRAIGPDNQLVERWGTHMHAEYTGELTSASPLRMTLGLHVGSDDAMKLASRLALDCTIGAIRVHPAYATLVQGWKHPDDSIEPASWAPSRTDLVSDAKLCKAAGEERFGGTFPFTTSLAFVRGRELPNGEVARGVEWSFVNSDMVIQEGGYRWIP
jgi:hypothetical protein